MRRRAQRARRRAVLASCFQTSRRTNPSKIVSGFGGRALPRGEAYIYITLFGRRSRALLGFAARRAPVGFYRCRTAPRSSSPRCSGAGQSCCCPRQVWRSNTASEKSGNLSRGPMTRPASMFGTLPHSQRTRIRTAQRGLAQRRASRQPGCQKAQGATDLPQAASRNRSQLGRRRRT